MAELPPQTYNPNINPHLQLDPATQIEFRQPTGLMGEQSTPLNPDVSASLAPETDPVTGAIDAQEGPIAATGIEVAAETTGRHHRNDDQEATIDPTIQTELTRLQTAKQNMIKIFGQDVYQERFANNPNVDPDAYVGKLQNEATTGRHAAVEVVQPDSETTTDPATEAAVAEEAVETARKAVKRSLSDLATEGVKLSWSEEGQAAPQQVQTQNDSPLSHAAKMGQLRAGWTNEEPDARSAFLNRQRRRSRPFTVSKQVDPRMRTQSEIDALTTSLEHTESIEVTDSEPSLTAAEAESTQTAQNEKAARLDQTINTLLQARRKHGAGEVTPLERPVDVEEVAWEGATEAQRRMLSDESLNRLVNGQFGMSLEDFDRVATDPARNNPDHLALGGTEAFLRDIASANAMESMYGSVFDRAARERTGQNLVRVDGKEFRELTPNEIGELRDKRERRRIGSRILRAVQGSDYNNRRAA